MIYVSPDEKDYYIYRNKSGTFRKSRNFRDVEKLDLTTIVGYDGNLEITAARGNILLFARDSDVAGEECFILVRRI